MLRKRLKDEAVMSRCAPDIEKASRLEARQTEREGYAPVR